MFPDAREATARMEDRVCVCARALLNKPQVFLTLLSQPQKACGPTQQLLSCTVKRTGLDSVAGLTGLLGKRSSFISVAVTNTLTKSNIGKAGFIWTIVPGYSSPVQRKQDGSSKHHMQSGAERQHTSVHSHTVQGPAHEDSTTHLQGGSSYLN